MAKRRQVRTCKASTLPHPDEMREALRWLSAGCPAAGRDYDAPHCAQVLYYLLDRALPEHLPVYCFGSDEQMAEYAPAPPADTPTPALRK